MTNLDNIKNVLDSNNDITQEIKDNMFELIVLFNNKFPTVSLDNLEGHLKSLRIRKSSKFFNQDISMYDCRNNVLYFNQERMADEYDFRHILMFELLNIISSNKLQTGFNSESKFEALNIGYTEILANYLVGNSGEKLIYPNEAIMANMIGIVIGNDNLFDSYFNNDPKILLNALVKAGVEL
ncbi:MAG: hypothetical protein E7173_00385 [Firmicutes bacterium]|nr:hypothetical protein [Bacillota bacterium]